MPNSNPSESHFNPLADRLSHAFAAMTHGMLYPGSESDSPYFRFCVPVTDGDLTVESLKSALHLASFWKLRLEPASDWFGRTIVWADDPNGGGNPIEADTYERLQEIMRANIEGEVWRLTAEPQPGHYHDTRHYVGGRVEKFFVGFMTYSVET